VFETGALLFADRDAETELTHELRLSELWGLCDSGFLAMDEFFELSALITQVQGLPGSLCVDCEDVGRPNVSANWALATTTLCRSHLRFPAGPRADDGGTKPVIEPPATPSAGQNGGRDVGLPRLRRLLPDRLFRLASGRTADHYFDKYRFESDPALLREIVAALVPSVPGRDRGSRRIGARGIPLATVLSSVTGLSGLLRAQAAQEVRHRASLRRR